MRDDDPKKSPEFLDETKPERNERSFFERLLGRESEEEKLRRKLDEELKEAARKRATDFEEERRVEEKREVSETKKLKKRWRAKLVEKSQKLLQDAAERGDEPINGLEIARLMVAERIVKIHDMLQNEDLRRSEVKTLKIHIDFMGLLSEKIDRPELEVPEEVEQLYATIAESVEAVTGETIPHANPPQSPEQPIAAKPEALPASEADTEYSLFASSIVRAIQKVVRPAAAYQGLGAGVDQIYPDDATGSAERRATLQEQNTSQVTEKILSVVKAAALSSEVIRQEIFHAETVRKLANVVEKAERMHARPTVEPSSEKSSVRRLVAAAVPAVALSGIVRSETTRDQPHRSPEASHATTSYATAGFPSPEKMLDIETRIETKQRSQKRIKDMTELELVTLAKGIEVGDGRLLFDVYKRGEIDREGLVKVLESHKKGLDYRSELAYRRYTWRRHREESQEYLAQPSTTSTQTATVPITKPESESHERNKQKAPRTQNPKVAKQTGDKLRNIGRTLAHPLTTQAGTEAKRVVKAAREQIERQNQVVVLFTSVLLVIVLVLILIGLDGR